MSDDFDQFFEEEEELAREQEAAETSSAKRQQVSRDRSVSRNIETPQKPSASRPAPGAPSVAVSDGGYRPPSLALVIIIAIVAILLGICIGYFVAMSLVDAGDTSVEETETVEEAVEETADEIGSEIDTVADEVTDEAAEIEEESGELPSGHPDVTGMLNEDGTVNEEAVAEYRAQRDAERESAAEETDTDEAADDEAVSDETVTDDDMTDSATD